MQLEQRDHLLRRQLLFDLGEDGLRGRDRGFDAALLEEQLVPRVVDAGDGARHAAVACKVADDEVVLVVAGNRRDEVSTRDPGRIEGRGLAGVALHDVARQFLANLRRAR